MTDLPKRWPRRGSCLALGAAATVAACAPSRPAPPPRAAGEPDVRIAVALGAPSVQIGGEGLVAGYSHGQAVVQGGVTLARDGRAVSIPARGSNGARYERLTFLNRTPGQFVTVAGKPYRGTIEVFTTDAGIVVVNELQMEDYIAGVVNVELGTRTAAERAAIEAQAIVARTYTLKNMGKYGVEGYDLRAGVSDQAYGGVASESGLAWEAVRATRGLAITYHGDVIAPFYHSTCGGRTAAPEEAFRTVSPLPYLRSISDARAGGFYCDVSPRFRWHVQWDGAMLAGIFRRTVPAAMGIDAAELSEVRGVSVRRRGPSGRVLEARIRVPNGEIPVYAPDIRSVFTTPEGAMLGSTAFELDVAHAGGTVTRVVAEGGGWGHGVGMCQWGAIGRARAGQDANAILTTYFPGTQIARRY